MIDPTKHIVMRLDTSRKVNLREDEVRSVLALLTPTPTHWRDLLGGVLGISERNRHKRLCAITAELRARGFPVCNKQEGYYLGSAEEALECVGRAISQELKSLRTHKIQRIALRATRPTGQLSDGASLDLPSSSATRQNEQQETDPAPDASGGRDAPDGYLFDPSGDASRL